MSVTPECFLFSASDDTAFDFSSETRTGQGATVPAFQLIEPLTIAPPDADQCSKANRASYVPSGIAQPSVLFPICSEAPFGRSLVLSSGVSAWDGGRDGTSIVLAFDLGPTDSLIAGVAGVIVNDRGQTVSCAGDGGQVIRGFGRKQNVDGLPPILPPLQNDHGNNRFQ